MGYQELSFKLPTDYTEEQLQQKIGKKLRLKQFSWQIDHKSLDARDKSNIHWQVRVGVFSAEIKVNAAPSGSELNIPFKKRNKKILIVGSGPAGFFCAFVLQKAGFQTTIIERGKDVKQRTAAIKNFETNAVFEPAGNYAFGEGGAGTFSDGKLTARSKHLTLEKKFIIDCYIEAGAPQEIAYLAHPHLGSDNLKNLVRKLRDKYQQLGGTILFETTLLDLKILKGRVLEIVTNNETLAADYFVIAPGHSAYDTFRLLMKKGVAFQTKNFAIGSRVEHPQTLINRAQFGTEHLPGVTAAEYRLTANIKGNLPVYTFCMCPGGVIVPSTAFEGSNIVNGMSNFKRSGFYANAACVAAVNPDTLLTKKVTAAEALDWLQRLEEKFYTSAKGYKAPACSITNFINKTGTDLQSGSSYPLGLFPAPLWELLPTVVSDSLREGLKDFSRKVKGFETGLIMGLESKTSSPVQVLRDDSMLCAGFTNLYMVGEGSGYSGGIISSAADGIKAALRII
ncbi:MAG: FAD-dependent oxidoreductase [Candidatus Margulisbacteria bacterium]|nr:FAD-dependent oxidoreductase [Candidatus Margulisiibacteriota bacterium]